MADKSYIGKGKVQIRPYASGAYADMGNASVLELSIEEEEKSLPDFQATGGGKANTLGRVTGMKGKLTLYDFTKENLAIALRGTASVVGTDDIVEALTTAQLEYKVKFVGFNEAQAGKAFAAELHRVKFSAVSGLGLIGDDFAPLELEFEALSDSAIVSGSKFAKITMAQ